MKSTRRRPAYAVAALAAVALPLAACAAAEDQQAVESEGPVVSLTLDDGWVVAADSGVTQAYGVLSNESADPVVVVDATTDVARDVEMVETSESPTGELVSEAVGELVVPAQGSITLEPGAAHLLLQDVSQPIEAGDEVTITLTTTEGRTVDVVVTAEPSSAAE